MKTFHCDKCGRQVFFENVRCEHCGGMLGYLPELRAIGTFAADGSAWRSLCRDRAGLQYKQCANYARDEVCNWMLPAESPDDLCASCRLTRVIPSLASAQNRLYWKRLETAKRRLLYSLWELHLQPQPKSDDPVGGLAFEFLEDMPENKVMTGHANGVITINIAEADPAHREKMREQMLEPYRTLLGHFRHESGHFYFDRLVAGTRWLEPVRALFGDERDDYAARLKAHYVNGPPADWRERFVSSYASAHPWEDWSETWAHYLHMFDTLDTAYACGMSLRPRKRGEPALDIEKAPLQSPVFDDIVSDWFSLTYVLNSLNRSIGMPDPYPFTLSTPAIDKLRLVHDIIRDGSRR